MGMVLIGRRLPSGENAVRENPETVEELLYGDLDDEAGMPGPELDLDLDLDKSWHAIHYLLTGTAWEIGEGAGSAVLGGDHLTRPPS